ncbi:MAG: hypothetical protein Q7S36_02150 [Candidatus Liptonbacteria bacterium]|nr:hypothetical protein [Candidatus Liptonbacteria bacterium]
MELALTNNKKRIPLILGCHNATRNGELDFRGIDIVVALKNGFCLLLQIKSSEGSLAKHKRRHPLIPAFVAKRDLNDIQIATEVLKIIRRQAKLPFEIATRYLAGESGEIKGLGGDMLVVLKNGFGLFVRSEPDKKDCKDQGKLCCQMPTIEIPGSWEYQQIKADLKKIIESRRKQFFKIAP